MKLLNTEQINRICMKNGFQQDKHEKNKINLIKNDIGNIEVNE